MKDLVLQCSLGRYRFCDDCQALLIADDVANICDTFKYRYHKEHRVRNDISRRLVTQPSLLLTPASDNKSNAQYFFSNKFVIYLFRIIRNLKFTHLLCLGTPRVHEVVLRLRNKLNLKLESLLLDIDARYSQFYTEREYIAFNMFNSYFFTDSGKKHFRHFLHRGSPAKSVLIVCDPPFGGLLEALSRTMNYLSANCHHHEAIVRQMIMLPYFMEKKLSQYHPHLKLLDYPVTYSNHKKLVNSDSSEGSSRCQSTVRIFTDVPASLVSPPDKTNYWFCASCSRYSHKKNSHCFHCSACTTKFGDIQTLHYM